MDGKNINLELIERHFEGKLTADELKDFNLQLKDEAFAQEVQIYEALMQGIDATGAMDFETMVQGWEAAIKKEPSQQSAKVVTMNNQRATRRLTGRRRILALAAVILALVIPSYFIFFMNDVPSNEALFAQNFERYSSTGIVKGDNTDELSRAEGLYSEEKYEEAIEAFEGYLKGENVVAEDAVKATFYLGIAQLAEGKASAAIDNLKTTISANNKAFTPAAEWYLALAYLKSNDTTKLNQQLDIIINQPKHYKNAAAVALKAAL